MLIRQVLAVFCLALPISVDTCDGCTKNTRPSGSSTSGGEETSVRGALKSVRSAGSTDDR